MQPHLIVNDITKRFGKAAKITNLSLDFPPGSKTFLVGGNGSGKTTLLKIMAGLFRADSGDIFVNAHRSPSKNVPPIGLFLGLDFIHPHASVRENLNFSATLFGVSSRDSAVDHSLAEWELQPLQNQDVGALSQGQKARVALARATIHRPSLLLLDEPWNFLDPRGEEILNRFLLDFSGTLVVTSPVPEGRPSYFTQSYSL